MVKEISVYTIDGFKDFINLREECRIYRDDPDWECQDEILRTKKFCNIDRSHDRGTVVLYNALEGKSIEYIIITTLAFRLFSSGNLICDTIKEFNELDEFHKAFMNMEQFSYRGIPYQFVAYVKGINFKTFFECYINKNREDIIKAVLELDGASYDEAIEVIHKAMGFHKVLKFGIFQAVLDIAKLYPNLINPDSKPHYGIGSLNSLRQILKNEDDYNNQDDLKESLKEYTSNSYTILEHGLCEYDKYCKYKIGIKKMNTNSQQYKKNNGKFKKFN